MDYGELVETYKELESDSKRLRKISAISRLLIKLNKQNADEELIRKIILLLQGTLFPSWDKRTLGVSSKLVVKAIAIASGNSEKTVNNLWREKGDLGVVAQDLMSKKKQSTLFSQTLTVDEVFEKLQKLASIEGTGSTDFKLKLIGSLLSSADGDGARFITRTVLDELRIGVAHGTLRDAIAVANFSDYFSLGEEGYYSSEEQLIKFETEFKIKVEHDKPGIFIKQFFEKKVQSAYDRANDFTKVAIIARQGINGLEKIKLILGNPIKVMLAQKEPTVEDGMKRVGLPSALEYKYDGFRMQVHKQGPKITIFTRRLENVTKQFPEVANYIHEWVKANECILDCEAVGYDSTTEKYQTFQHIGQRIKRKYDIEELAKKLPVELNVFDILYLDGEELLDKSFAERRKLLEKTIPVQQKKKIVLSKLLITEDFEKGLEFNKESLAVGNEGIMCKNLNGKYSPGSRVGHMVKVKPTMDTMDLVVVKAEWGEGKRSGWFTSFTLACVDDEDNYLEIGKVGTGIKELEQENTDIVGEEVVTFKKVTDILKSLIIKGQGREVIVNPKLIFEIKFDEIQQSPTYSSRYALRFPRVVKIRNDLSLEDDLTTLDEVHDAYELQKRINR